MTSDLFKVISLAAFGLGAAVVPCAARRRWHSKAGRWLRRMRERATEAADLAGMRLSPRMAAALAVAGPAVLPFLSFIRQRRLVRCDRQLPDALSLLAGALKAGLALPQALEMASLELAEPLGPEFSRVVAQLKLGRSVEEALSLMRERLPTDDMGLVVQSVEVLRRTGGNLVETFGTLAQTVEARLRVEERIRVLTAQGMIQGAMLLAMPWALVAALLLVAPDYLSPLFTTKLGAAFVAAGIVMEVVGAWWLRRIAIIRV